MIKINFPQTKITAIAALFIVLVAGATSDLIGQENSISKAEFEIRTKSGKASEGKSLRRTTLIERLVNGVASPEKERKNIFEAIPPDRTRYIVIRTFNGKSVKSETINIGPRSWIRTNDGPWTVPEVLDGITGGNGVGASAVTFQSFTSKGKTTLFGVTVSEYETVRKMTSSYDDDAAFQEIETKRIWIDESGLKVKEVYENENLNTKETYRQTITNEYNPKDLKIETPTK